MTAEKAKKKKPERIVVTRTESVECLLQRLWTLRPEYAEKPSLTFSCAVAALIREAERIDGVPRARKAVRATRVDQKSEPAGLVIFNPDSEWT